MGVFARGNCLLSRRSQELMCRNDGFPDLSGLVADHPYAFGQLGRMGEEERQVEGPRLIENAPGGFQIAPLLRIGSALLTMGR